MATMQNVEYLSLPVASDLSASQWCFVDINSAGRVALAGAGTDAIGVMADTEGSALGRVTAVMTKFGAKTKVKLGATVAAGAYVKSDSTGRAVTATSGTFVLGRCVDGGDVNNIGSIIFGTTGGKMF